MATAPSDRSSKAVAKATGPRFRLAALICQAGSAEYWNAVDGRSGRAVALRVSGSNGDDLTLRVAELQRERALCERIGPVGLLRCESPIVEDGRILQAVSPEPAGSLTAAHPGQPVAMLRSLIGVGEILARVHARGAWHGAVGADCCLLGRDGRVLLTGCCGDGEQAEARRDGIAGDIAAFARTALQLLEEAGGVTPRVRALLGRVQRVVDGGSAPMSMAEICAELRESLEDTFPLPPPPEVAPAAVETVASAAPADPVSHKAGPPVAKKLTLVHPVSTTPRPAAPAAAVASVDPVATPGAPRPTPGKATVLAAAIAAASGGSATHGPTARASTVGSSAAATDGDAPIHSAARPAPTPVKFPAFDADLDVPPPRRRGLPALLWGNAAWIVGFAVVAAVLGMLLWNRGSPPRPAVPPVTADAVAPLPADTAPSESVAEPTGVAAVPPVAAEASRAPATPASSAPAAAAKTPSARATPSETSASTVAATPRTSPAAARQRTQDPTPPRTPATATPPRASTPLAAAATSAPPERAASADAASGAAPAGRAGQLVRDGEAALAQLDATGARASFEEALRLAPGSRRARDGLNRARRLEGVAAVARDAGDAAIRGDVARAVQGYAQAAAAVPESKAIQESLRAAQAAFGEDEYGRSLAAGYEALGAGRLEEARAAFGQAERARPGDPAGRRGMSQTLTAIRVREEAAGRRAEGASATP